MTIISISGKMGSGKNTVASIIQYLTNPFDRNMKTEFNLNEDYSVWGDWKQVAFAAKLKQIVSILTGIPVEDLEKREVKSSILGENWWYWNIFKTSQRVPYQGNEDFDKTDLSVTLIKPTVRQLMVEIADDIRAKNSNAFINALFADYKGNRCEYFGKCLCGSGEFSDGSKGLALCETSYPSWIITDVRFSNELEAVKQRGGITIRVNRLHNEKFLHDIAIASAPFGVGAKMLEQNASYTHESETALDTATFRYIIDNDGTIEELIEKVKEILILEKII